MIITGHDRKRKNKFLIHLPLSLSFMSSADTSLHTPRSRRSITERDSVFVRFEMPLDDKLYAGVEEAVLRLMLQRHASHQNHRHHHLHDDSHVQVHAYQLAGPGQKILLDSVSVPVGSIGQQQHGKWIEFNVRSAVNGWIEAPSSNAGFEIDCRGCDKLGIRVVQEHASASPDFYTQEDGEDAEDELLRDDNTPALNIVTRTRSSRGKRSRVLRPYRLHAKKLHHTKCEEHNGQKCCRSELHVVFRDLKPMNFIIQPKMFDAGYCRGKCPFSYNTASNHAYLQGMIWRQDHKKVPRPCCAPNKLEDLQVLHIDESDPTKLKVSTMQEMRVLECACS